MEKQNLSDLLDRLESVKYIGEGVQAKIILGRDKHSKKLYAIKSMPKHKYKHQHSEDRRLRQILTEQKILENIDHPFVIKLVTDFETEDSYDFVMEYAPGGDLSDMIQDDLNGRRLTNIEARFYGAEIILALKHLHDRGIVHRDLKMENVLLDKSGHVKIIDFGMSKVNVDHDFKMSSLIGTIVCFAPELFEKNYKGFSVDWWSFGVIMYEMLCGKLPFYHDDISGQKILVTNKEPEYPSYLSPSAKSLLQKLLIKNPAERLGCGPRDAEEVMEHPFFRKVDWKKVEEKKISAPFRPTEKNS